MKFEWLNTLNNYVPEFIRRNFLRKMIALIFAILVYMKVSTEIGEEKIIQGIPINFVTHGNIEVMAFKPKTINITVRASKRNINLITHNDIRVEVPISESILKDYDSTQYNHITMDINESNIHTPPYIRIISINPTDVTVHCEKNITKKALVEPIFRGVPPLDYKRGNTEITPQHVTLTGPESILREIKSVSTDPIRLDMSTIASFQADKKLQIIDPKIIVTPNTVQVKVEIYKALSSRVFENIPLELLNEDNNNSFKTKLLTKSVDVTLHGPKSHLELLTHNQIKTFIDISDYKKPGIYEAKVRTWCQDPSVNVKFVEPTYVKIELLGNIE